MENLLELEFPIFSDYTIFVVLTDDVIKARRERDVEIGESLDEDASGADALHCYNEDGTGLAWMIFNYNATPGIIAHESHHAVLRLMKWIGAKSIDEEIFAYHIEHVVEKVWNFKLKVEREKERAKCLVILEKSQRPLS